MTELSLEQELRILNFNQSVQKMSESEVKEKLVQLYREMVIADATYKQLIGAAWGFV